MNSSRASLPDRDGTIHDRSGSDDPGNRAGALYAIIVFLIGFILGTIRVLLLAPGLGETAAVMLEVPIMLTANWFVSGRCVDRCATYGSLAGAIGLGAQVIFAMFPVIQGWRR
jgi:hypothetical protein